MRAALRGPELVVRTVARRLAPLGLIPTATPADGDATALAWELDGFGGDDLEVDVSWYRGAGPADERRGHEAVVQAVTGLMQVHGRDVGRPRRLGLEVASVAAGLLAASATVAALVGRRRGRLVTGVESSTLDAGLLLVSHRVAAATTATEWMPALPGPAPGPPFRSADDVWFELETLDPEAWKAFWLRLGAGGADLGWAWKLFRSRFFRGTATLPPGLHEAVGRHRLAEVAEAARACDVSLCPVRPYPKVLADLGPWPGHPLVTDAGKDNGAPAGVVSAPPGGGPDAEGLPLAGLRVVESTTRLQGPLAGLLLQMLGAEVIRVEPPGGDPARGVPPLVDETGSFFLCFNRGKASVELDLARPGGRSALEELVAGADAFVHNWRPGKAEEWGLDPARLGAVNPGLVYSAASGWGPGRHDAPVGTDFLVQAHAGVAAGLTPDGQPPMPSRALLTDYFGALVTAEGVLAGLYRRELTGRGCRVATSLLAGAMALQAHVLEALAAGREDGRRRQGRPVWCPLDHPIDAADRLVALAVDDDGALVRLCLVCDVDPADNHVERAVAARLAERPASEWEERLAEAAIPCGAVCTDLAGLPADPRLAVRFEVLAGPCRAPASPWALTPSTTAAAGPPDLAVAGGPRP